MINFQEIFLVGGISIIFTIINHLNITTMYSLNCNFYAKSFKTLDALIDDVLSTGMDPNYEITRDGKLTGEILWDFIVP
jgi:hypothetical protein